MDDYKDFVRTEGALVVPVGPVEPHRVRDTTPSRVWDAFEQVRGYEPVLRWADVETLHELRIAGKWLRYTLEFVREALGPDSAPLIERITALQDHLGLMHDADVSAVDGAHIPRRPRRRPVRLESAAIGRYLVDREKTVVRLRRSIGIPWRASRDPVSAVARSGGRRPLAAPGGRYCATRARSSGRRSRQPSRHARRRG